MSDPIIRPMTAADIEPARAAILRADWGDRGSWFEFAVGQPECRPLVAEVDGVVVGTGVGTANGSVGWVGTIWVDPALRGVGLGRALTQAAIDSLDAAGCRTLLLVATEAGLPLYERLGFVVQTRYRILEAPGIGASEAPAEAAGAAATAARASGEPTVRAFEPADLDAVIALDREATGEDRGHVISRFASPATARVSVRGGIVTGFVVRAPWGGGATIALTPADAMAILEARRLASGPAGRVRVGLVEENGAGLAALETAGLRPIWSAPRLIRGEPLDWHPDRIWGQFNHAIG